ncbi:MAG TPA: hypothetical protein DEF00_02990 [Candidatus Taylorbacteria bacterium]|nr:MAG: hypothetical protein UY03_C0003G0009 [Parcubacteria group bacterium GW2011_GWA2_47_64]KKU96796.1 MAG: hypothetical protein UY29_C0006G0005 [Parcubacteria group bacterium GW2011_GWC2_48_17]HBV01331.1 hypothetical protein [Candidatus Taylorbacteria bacterium]
MNPQQQRENFFRFIDALPQAVVDSLSQKNLDIIAVLHEVCVAREFVLYEMGNICEGVVRVLAGKDSPSNLLAFIQQDQNIEEDNRAKIPALAYEIQQKIFDPVLPILKQAGFPIKEGKVAEPASSFQVQGSSQTKLEARSHLPAKGLAQAGNLAASSVGLEASSLKLEPNHMRALMRIAAGTAYSELQLRDAFEDLPPGLRQSLSSVDTANSIQGIAKKYLLHVDQMASLASETGLVLLGLTHPADFIGNLGKRLRLKEEEAREIAREISAEIFVKVRDSLRGLHEPKPASSFQVLGSSQKPTESPKVAPVSSSQSSATLNAKRSTLTASSRYPLNASLETPYSPQAKWNTGENILSKQAPQKQGDFAGQAPQKEAPLSREGVLRGVENPKSIKRDSPLEANSYQLKANQVGPTGWKPSQNEVGSMNYELRKPSIPTDLPRPPAPKPPIAPKPFQPSAPGEKRRPSDIGPLSVPEKPTDEPNDFLEEKLQRPVTMPKEEKHYSSDPYREPLE